MFFSPDLILIAAAVIPAIILMIYVYRQDHLEKEPKIILASLILLGVISTSLAEITENIGLYILNCMDISENLYNILLYFVVVAVSEEGFKYLLLKIRTWKLPDFNCQFDGVVYAVFVSLGFALWENIGYTFAYGFSTAIVRAFTAIPGHTCFGVFMGVFYGISKRYELIGELRKSRFYRRLAVIIPVILHGQYDYFATESNNTIWAFVLFTIILFIISFRLVKIMSSRDRYIRSPENF